MVPKVARLGRSFKGAAAYYLHDKKADTAERVAFTETVNLPTNDARRAIAHMIDTATHANDLKAANGVKATGNKLKNPVYTYSIAWHPTQAPTMAEQIAAARETLGALGLSDRQALIVGHNDTAHPHVHVIVNRVSPENGLAAKHGNDFNALSRWAEDYERRTGKILCLDRVENNAERDRGQWVKDNSPTPQEHRLSKKEETALLWKKYGDEKAAAKEARKPKYEALWKKRAARIEQRKKEVKAHHAPAHKAEWRELYKKQKYDLGRFDAFYLVRFKTALQDSRGGLKPHIEAIFSANTKLRRNFLKQQQAERKRLSDQQFLKTREAIREVHMRWEIARDELNRQAGAENKKRFERYKGESESIWNKGKATSVWNAPKQESVWDKGKTNKPTDPDGRTPGRSRSKGRTRNRSRQ